MSIGRSLVRDEFLGEASTRDFCLVYPDVVQTAKEKILFALWRFGELPYYKLMLLTGLKVDALNEELSDLLNNQEITTTKRSASSRNFRDGFGAQSFRVTRKSLSGS